MDMAVKNIRLVASFKKCSPRVRFDAACELIYIYNLAKEGYRDWETDRKSVV